MNYIWKVLKKKNRMENRKNRRENILKENKKLLWTPHFGYDTLPIARLFFFYFFSFFFFF